jgi:hypothetical protein
MFGGRLSRRRFILTGSRYLRDRLRLRFLSSGLIEKWLVLILNRLKYVNRLQNSREGWGAFSNLSGCGLG